MSILTAHRLAVAVCRIVETTRICPRIFRLMKTYNETGFTLYELLITMLVLGVVLAVGIPNMNAFTANNRITASANDLHASFLLGRSEAARSKANITICASANSLDAPNADCGGEFEDGWIVFEDTDGDVIRDAGEPLLRSYPETPQGIDIISQGNDYFSFAPTGLGRGNVGVGPALQAAILCDHRGNVPASGGFSAARALIVLPIGRATVLRDIAIIDGRGGCP